MGVMEHRSRFAGFDIHIKNDAEGFTFQVRSDPEHQEARREVFALYDQLSREARRAGVSGLEILGYAMQRRWRSRTQARPRRERPAEAD